MKIVVERKDLFENTDQVYEDQCPYCRSLDTIDQEGTLLCTNCQETFKPKGD